MLNPLSLSILVAAFPRKQLPQAIGIWAGISGLGLAIGPLLGGFLTEHVDWSAVFWINVPIGIVAAAVCLWAVVESRDPSAQTLDVVGTVLITGGLFSLTWALIKTVVPLVDVGLHARLPGRGGRAAGRRSSGGSCGSAIRWCRSTSSRTACSASRTSSC